ncbi:acyl carrier protein [Micromonospora sp. WMMD961]|uniref:acyl carrier protein n=1 Tax=Micromonospora sp. WMMD961 TaxID=3016100 RepID=UPI0024175B98|nr:acyl carrier protein [Micromonospora sp. WMMD961]MDG4780087.1 acyl carrier protein [Micromonospora sp. WMMD961]
MNDEKPDLMTQVTAAWANALDVPVADVPLDTNFFEAGGDSLLLIVVLEELEGLTDRPLEAADLFQHNTVRAQTELLADEGGERKLTLLGARNRGSLLGRRQGAVHTDAVADR